MGRADVPEGAQKVDLEEERRRREQAPKGGTRKATTTAASTAGLEKQLKGFYETLVGGMFFVDPEVAEFQAKHVERLAVTQAAWAKENAYVRRFLETMVSGSIAAAAIGEAAIVVGGSVLIVQAKRGALDPRFMPAAAFLGVTLPPPVVPSDNGGQVREESPEEYAARMSPEQDSPLGEDEPGETVAPD